MEDIYAKIKKYIAKYQMIKAGDTIAAGVSGGADSVCMLFLLWELSKVINFRLLVVHVHHGVRMDADRYCFYSYDSFFQPEARKEVGNLLPLLR